MKLITRDTDYAIRALCFIAAREGKEKVTADMLVRQLRIPRPFLRKILQLLNKKGVLCSFKGASGGFILAESAKRIYLMDLINIFQGPLKINECLFKKHVCPNTKLCLLKKRIDAIEEKVKIELELISIADLIV